MCRRVRQCLWRSCGLGFDLDLAVSWPAQVDRASSRQAIPLNVVNEMDAMMQIKDLVARGSGYTIFAPAAAYDFVARGEISKGRP